jgi:hypothetical protein
MRIVQSLVLSDLILGLVGIVGTSLVLSGKPLEAGTGACSGLGYCLVVVLWTEHLWTLILAIATYMILIYVRHVPLLLRDRLTLRSLYIPLPSGSSEDGTTCGSLFG